jgi:hypothetical protein
MSLTSSALLSAWLTFNGLHGSTTLTGRAEQRHQGDKFVLFWSWMLRLVTEGRSQTRRCQQLTASMCGVSVMFPRTTSTLCRATPWLAYAACIMTSASYNQPIRDELFNWERGVVNSYPSRDDETILQDTFSSGSSHLHLVGSYVPIFI